MPIQCNVQCNVYTINKIQSSPESFKTTSLLIGLLTAMGQILKPKPNFWALLASI